MSRSSLYPPSVDPGFPSLGPVPTGWTRTTFGSALEKVERPLDLELDRKYRLVTAKRNRGGIVLRSELLGSEILTKTQFAARAGDFLISRRQIIHGACGVVPEDLDGAVVSNEYSTLRTLGLIRFRGQVGYVVPSLVSMLSRARADVTAAVPCAAWA